MDFSAEISYVRFALSRDIASIRLDLVHGCRDVERKAATQQRNCNMQRNEWSVRGAGEWNVSEMNIEFIEGFDFGGCLREL